MTNQELFSKAHKLAKAFQGDYSACFALAVLTIKREEKEAQQQSEPFRFETRRYASGGFKDSAFSLSLDDDGMCEVAYADVSYPDGYRHKKQNYCVMTAEHGLVVDYTGSGRYRGHETNAQHILDECTGFYGQTFEIKDFLKKFYNIKFDWSQKAWVKQ